MSGIDLSEIYANPIIPEKYYFVQLEDMQLEYVGTSRPRIMAYLRVAPVYEESVNGKRFASIVHETARADAIFEAFWATFVTPGDDLRDGIGKFGSVKVKPAEYNGTRYGVVGYVRQPRLVVLDCFRLQQLNEDGELDWP